MSYRILYVGFFILALSACQPNVRFANNASKQNTNNKKNEDSYTTPQTTVTKTTQGQRATSTTASGNIRQSSDKILTIAESWLGVSYKYAGNDKGGIDCSGFVKNVYNEAGIDLPRTSSEQYLVAIPTEKPEIGDLVFFKKEDRIYHVGIYSGNNSMIHASNSKGVIKQSLDEKTFIINHAGFGKVKRK